MVKPLRNNILIDLHKIADSAISMVDESEAQIEKATVLDIGDEVTLVKKGDIILYKKYNLDQFEIDGITYYMIPEDDVKAICK